MPFRGGKGLPGSSSIVRFFGMQTRWIFSLLLLLLISVQCAQGAEANVAAATAAGEQLSSDTKRATPDGATFVVPGGWWIETRGNAVILTPEGDSRLGLVDVHTNDADAAVKMAWSAMEPNMKWALK